MAAIVLLLVTLARPAEGVVTETRPAMGSVASVTIAGTTPDAAAPAIEAAFAVFRQVEWSMNEWRDGSPLAQLNAWAGRGWLALPGDLCEVLALAKEAAVRTGGRFDPTWAALSDLWRFDGSANVPPPDDAVRARCTLVDHRLLELRPRGAACEARLARPGMRVGLGGLAKGWALDAAARVLRARGHRNFLLQAGGDLYAAGTRGGRPWRVGVRDPRGGPLDELTEVDVRDRAFSTSGDYEHAYLADGQRYHHLIDPRTCRPATASRAVTVLARRAVDAEILGKSLFIQGGERALREASRWGAEALIVDADGAVHATRGLRGAAATAERP
ncbi:FAD:protein FMN transferase [Anaeromyxobacter terrae]|uniref:FAD:protein FMN transferase n=1 Tax=Anaeromyxobacter terrae TaxID=2925406 RepID=UPI001F5A1C56|nr:FAD:protein FMN transferase [Anaeromyxobacter sp. SG22]